MARALTLHDEAIRALIAAHEGRELKTEGDAFIVTFPAPELALAWALELQVALLGLDWPAEILAMLETDDDVVDGRLLWRGLRVRVGLHVGEAISLAHPQTGALDVYGPHVNRAARTCNAAHGGQILLTQALLEALPSDTLRAGGLTHRELGTFRFRGMEEPERLHEILPGALVGRRFPPLRAERPRRTNLEPDPTSFVGREAERQEIDRCLASGARLITLLGPGGVGKTRLSREWALARIPAFQEGGGVWFCDLSGCTSASAMAQTLGAVLDLALQASSSSETVEQIGHALRSRGRTLLVLDNLEQIVDLARPAVEIWLRRAQDLVVLVTSREALGLRGEQTLLVEPLSGEESISLFQDRAAARGAHLDPAVEDQNLRRLIRALDGLPLAIELAASRAAALSPAAMLSRLSRITNPSGRPDPTLPPRHATLRAAVAWSWELLEPARRRALSRCTVFRGGFSLEAAEALLGDEDTDALDLISDLQERSLLRCQALEGGEARYQMLAYIRLFVLEVHPPPAELVRRHARYYADLGAALAQGFIGPQARSCLRRLSLERENLEAASESGFDPDAPRAALALDAILERTGPLDERLLRLDRLLADTRLPLEPELRLRLICARGQALRALGRTAEALGAFQEALTSGAGVQPPLLGEILRGVASTYLDLQRWDEARPAFARALEAVGSDTRTRAQILINVAVLMRRSGDREGAARTYEEARTEAHVVGDMQVEGLAYNNLSLMRRDDGRWEEANQLAWQALLLFRAAGDQRSQGMALNNLAIVASELSNAAQALELFAEARALFRHVGNQAGEARVLNNIALIRLEQGRVPEAKERVSDALSIFENIGSKQGIAISRGLLGFACCLEDRLTEALAWLDSAVLTLQELNDPFNLAFHVAMLGATMADLGRLDEARSALLRLQSITGVSAQDLGRLDRLAGLHVALATAGPVLVEEALSQEMQASSRPRQELRLAIDLLRAAVRRRAAATA